MPPARWTVCILVFLTLLQSGCTLLTVAKVVSTPVGMAGEVVKQTGKVATKTVAVGGKVTGSAVVGAGRMATSGLSSGSRVSAASVDGASRVVISGTGAGTRVAASGVEGAGRVSAAGVDSTTRVAAASVEAAGTLSAVSIRSLSQMSVAGMVTVVDLSSGTVTRVPWRAGLNVYGSGVLAKVSVAERALAVVRSGQLVFNTAKALAAARALPLQAGDVIRLADYIG